MNLYWFLKYLRCCSVELSYQPLSTCVWINNIRAILFFCGFLLNFCLTLSPINYAFHRGVWQTTASIFLQYSQGFYHFVNSYWGRISGTIGIESIAVEIGVA
jgi:hypothetical protein